MNSPPTGGPPGRDRPEFTPIVACFALILTLGLQFALPYKDLASDVVGLAVRRPRLITIPPLPEYPAILSAPIFAPDRHPGDPAEAAAGAGTLGAYAALGSVAGRGVGSAVISGPGGVVKALKVGETLDGWRLTGVSASKLIFERNGAKHALVVGEPAAVVSGAAPTDSTEPPNP